jgi:DNA-binding CsgD family transcriptional regulator
LIKATKTSDEIAGMLEVTVRSVEKVRQRIREKLSLPTDADLIVFFIAV